MKFKITSSLIGLCSLFLIAIFSVGMNSDTAFAITEFDRDNDGIPDELDECPQFAETYNKYLDSDGCPDSISEEKTKFQFPDSDGDGIEDRLDKCVNDPETFNGYLDNDGCPEIIPQSSDSIVDSDSDSIPDSIDACPYDKETINGFKDYDGCPDSLQPTKSEKSGFLIEGQCRDNKVSVTRNHTKDVVCVSQDTAEKWEKYGIATINVPDDSEKIATETKLIEESQPKEQTKKEPFDFNKNINEFDPNFSSRSDTEKQNLGTVLSFLSSLISWDEEKAMSFLSDNFVQHNPTMPGDKIGTIKKLSEMFSQNSTDIKLDIKRVYADGSYILVHSNLKVTNQVNGSLIDIFKIDEDGKIIEHWDVMQEIPKTSVNKNTMFYLN